jgi:hypothetical protein
MAIREIEIGRQPERDQDHIFMQRVQGRSRQSRAVPAHETRIIQNTHITRTHAHTQHAHTHTHTHTHHTYITHTHTHTHKTHTHITHNTHGFISCTHRFKHPSSL